MNRECAQRWSVEEEGGGARRHLHVLCLFFLCCGRNCGVVHHAHNFKSFFILFFLKKKAKSQKSENHKNQSADGIYIGGSPIRAGESSSRRLDFRFFYLEKRKAREPSTIRRNLLKNQKSKIKNKNQKNPNEWISRT